MRITRVNVVVEQFCVCVVESTAREGEPRASSAAFREASSWGSFQIVLVVIQGGTHRARLVSFYLTQRITGRQQQHCGTTAALRDNNSIVHSLFRYSVPCHAQGESEDELPERLIGSARIARPDLGRAEPLDW